MEHAAFSVGVWGVPLSSHLNPPPVVRAERSRGERAVPHRERETGLVGGCPPFPPGIRPLRSGQEPSMTIDLHTLFRELLADPATQAAYDADLN